MPAVFDDILDALSSGEYVTFDTIRLKSRLNEEQVEAVLSFLEYYGFVRRQRKMWSTRTQRAKLTPGMLNFLRYIKELEDSEETEARIGFAREAEL